MTGYVIGKNKEIKDIVFAVLDIANFGGEDCYITKQYYKAVKELGYGEIMFPISSIKQISI